jgi:hypothetical protein
MACRKAGGTAGLIHNTAGAGVLVLVADGVVGMGERVGVTDGSGVGEQAARMDMRMIEMMFFFMGSKSKTASVIVRDHDYSLLHLFRGILRLG